MHETYGSHGLSCSVLDNFLLCSAYAQDVYLWAVTDDVWEARAKLNDELGDHFSMLHALHGLERKLDVGEDHAQRRPTRFSEWFPGISRRCDVAVNLTGKDVWLFLHWEF